MTTIKNVTEDKGKKKPKSLIGFLIANKINNCNRRGEKGKKEKIQTNLQNMSKNKDNNCFS